MIDIHRVRTRAHLKEFTRLPWMIYRGDRDWVPPLISEVEQTVDLRALVDGSATHEAFLARRDGEVVGRVWAAIDPRMTGTKEPQAGHLSLFESLDDTAIACALLAQAVAWLRERGATLVRGPVCPAGPAIDEHKGVLVDGFDQRPYVLTSYNPPYYAALFQAAGFEKDADLYAYHMTAEGLFTKDPARIVQYAERRYGFHTDPMNLGDVEAEVRAIKHVLDVAIPAEWEDMAPPSLDEVRQMASRLVPLVDPDITAIVRAGDEPVGFGIAIPDYNQVLAHLNGRLLPFGWAKALYWQRKIDKVRVFALGVKPEYQHTGVAARMYEMHFEAAARTPQSWGEMGWILETNKAMNRAMEGMGGRVVRRYRVYERELSGASG